MDRREIIEKARPFLKGTCKLVYVDDNGQVFRHASLAHRHAKIDGIKVHLVELKDLIGLRELVKAAAGTEKKPAATTKPKKAVKKTPKSK